MGCIHLYVALTTHIYSKLGYVRLQYRDCIHLDSSLGTHPFQKPYPTLQTESLTHSECMGGK